MPNLLCLFAPHSPFLALGLPGGWEWIVLLVLGLLIFGRRLPDVGRSLGRGIVEFKKGIKGIEEEINEESSRPARPRQELSDQAMPKVPTKAKNVKTSDRAPRTLRARGHAIRRRAGVIRTRAPHQDSRPLG